MEIENQEAVVEQQDGANTGNSPAPATNPGTQNSPAPGANTGATEVPFHKNPEFQSYLERQKKGWERDYNRKFEEMQKTYDQKFQELQNSFRQPGQSLSEQDASQLRQLAKLIKSDPEAAKILGLDSIGSLQERIESMNSMSLEQAIEQETQSVIGDYAKKYGYDPKTLEQDILDFVSNDPYWSNQPQAKGVITKAARDFFSDKQQELADRAANMKLVTENQNKTKASSQKPIGTSQASQEAAPKSMREAIRNAMKKHSGEAVFGR